MGICGRSLKSLFLAPGDEDTNREPEARVEEEPVDYAKMAIIFDLLAAIARIDLLLKLL